MTLGFFMPYQTISLRMMKSYFGAYFLIVQDILLGHPEDQFDLGLDVIRILFRVESLIAFSCGGEDVLEWNSSYETWKNLQR